VKAMVDAAVQWVGRVDCQINNAGIPAPITGVAEMEAATIDQILGVNVRGLMLATKHAARVMLSRGTGSIINIGSIAAHRGGLSGHIYTASKGAVLAFTRSTAAELGETGIRVNSISPGAIVTGIFGKLAGVEASKADRLTDLVKERFSTLQPIPRAGLTDDIARAAVYLASDGSSFVNGQDIIVDGGMTTVTRGWSTMVAGRTEMSNRIKAAAASL
jgi:NAD(P)-dependent dehydrogenase (short-subunit alcohol dehydrogenase family)